MEKTNAMRLLDRQKIPYSVHTYEPDGVIDGEHTAALIGVSPEHVYKTLVTKGAKGGHFVFVVPVHKDLDLKAAAKAAGEKAVEMIAVKEITPLTGYVRGGCCPLGMKKAFPTVFDESCRALDRMHVSGGKIGVQIELAPEDLIRAAGGKTAAITRGS